MSLLLLFKDSHEFPRVGGGIPFWFTTHDRRTGSRIRRSHLTRKDIRGIIRRHFGREDVGEPVVREVVSRLGKEPIERRKLLKRIQKLAAKDIEKQDIEDELLLLALEL